MLVAIFTLGGFAIGVLLGVCFGSGITDRRRW